MKKSPLLLNTGLLLVGAVSVIAITKNACGTPGGSVERAVIDHIETTAVFALVLWILAAFIIRLTYAREISRGFLLPPLTSPSILLALMATIFSVSAVSAGIFLFCREDTQLTAWVVFFSAIGAIAGWIFTSYVNMVAARKHHTMNLLMQPRTSSTFLQRITEIRDIYPYFPSKVLPESDAHAYHHEQLIGPNNSSRKKALDAIRYLLNYYEFVASAIKHGDADFDLMKETHRRIVCEVFTASTPLILKIRGEETIGENAEDRAYENLIALTKAWER